MQGEFNALKEQLTKQYHDRAAMVFSYDEPLSHLIYAGSDLFLVPSMFEPCERYSPLSTPSSSLALLLPSSSFLALPSPLLSTPPLLYSPPPPLSLPVASHLITLSNLYGLD